MTGHLAPEDLGAVAALADAGAADPRLAHLADCPRCRALLESYRDFVRGEPEPQANLADAHARLARALAAEIGAAAPAAPRALRPAAGPRRGLLAALFAPALRPAWAVAAAVAIAAGVWVARPHGPVDVLRGPAAPTIETHVAAGAGSVTLRWRRFGNASRYEVRFYATDLSDLTRVDAHGALELTLRHAAPPARLASGARVLWQVVAFAGDAELARSQTRSLIVP